MQPESLPPPPRWLAGHLGLGFLTHVRWGHGMMAKASILTLALFGVLAVVAARVPSEWAMLLVAVAAIVVLFSALKFIFDFAKTEVAPLSWTPDLLNFGSPQWQENAHPIRRNFAGR
jgi:hypothetical protein